MYYKLAHIGFYVFTPVGKWLSVIFLLLNFLMPLIVTWAGDMLGMFFQQLSDEIRGFFLKFLPDWMQQ